MRIHELQRAKTFRETDASVLVLYVNKIEAQYGRSISVDRLLQNLEDRATLGNAIG